MAHLPRYFMRKLSATWFSWYLIICGVAFNFFAVFSMFQAVFAPVDRSIWQAHRVRMELEDAQFCSKHLNGLKIQRGNGQTFALKAKDGTELEIPYRSLSTFGWNKEGELIESVDLTFGGPGAIPSIITLFLIVSDDLTIERCLPSYQGFRAQQMECVAASGEFLSTGECVLPVNQPSDCQLMKGSLNGTLCSVPSTGRILRAAAHPYVKGTKCVAPNCKPGEDGDKTSPK